jgi:hypothetical protein
LKTLFRMDKLCYISVLFCGMILSSCNTKTESLDIRQDSATGQVILRNGRIELIIETKAGINASSLRDLKSGRKYADQDYLWSWSDARFPQLEGAPVIKNLSDSVKLVTLRGRLGEIIVQQSFTISKNDPDAVLEIIEISNTTDRNITTSGFKCGFSKGIKDGETWLPDATNTICYPVPYKRETDSKIQDFPLREVTEHGKVFSGWMEPKQQTPIWGAEGWVWSDTKTSFLISKFNDDGMEWSLMESVKQGTKGAIRFGGAGQWKHGHPEGASQLKPGTSFRFGETRLHVVDGDWKQAFYSYRRYTESKGCRTPVGYNPPVHWNELYDNAYFDAVAPNCFKPGWLAANHKRIAFETYSLQLMKSEAAKAKELGCEALYLDPNWDVAEPPLSTHIWDSARLGPMESFVRTMREDYGLKVSLWCGLAGAPPTFTDPASLPMEARSMDKNGNRMDIFCVPSQTFLNTTVKRLQNLCRNGAAFLMFDSDQFGSPCYDPTHGHSIPSTREEHARGLLKLVQLVKSQYPQTLFEMHDFITGPGSIHYSPTYYLYSQTNSFDCLWGHEFMWDSMNDLLSGKAISLYYFNLAYSIPLYLHVNLKRDNANAIMFWWYASTCRHLGVGGKSSQLVWEAQKRAMKTYLANKRFFTQGIFCGLEETVHAHTLPDIRESVINVFNLENKSISKTIRFRLEEIGLGTGRTGNPIGEELSINVNIPALGHQLLLVTAKPGEAARISAVEMIQKN